VPELANLSSTPLKTDTAVVFVHGTLSCGIQGLKDLYPRSLFWSSGPSDKPNQVYRYEHDTFLSVRDNGTELADLIARHLDAKRLLIAAHSRGGLVARVAQAFLAKNSYPGKVTVYTFGTPHFGTPLVHMGRGVLNALLSVGGYVVDAIPLAAPLSKALGYVYSPSELPPGIEIMDERSQARDFLNDLTDPAHVTTWGAKFDLAGQPSGFGVMTTGFLLGSFGNVSNDLVVPTASALGYGTAQPILNCSHTQYFCDPNIRKAIRAFEPPPPSDRTAQTRPQQTIVVTDDAVIIGGIRVPKRKI
jgi:pimeloyl-ACP methyl ester carboxylesterase